MVHPLIDSEPDTAAYVIMGGRGGRQREPVRFRNIQQLNAHWMLTPTQPARTQHPDGTPMSAQQFMEMLFGKLPEFFEDEAELRAIWSAPDTRRKLLRSGVIVALQS